jgi:hypothetical protein
MKRLVRMLGFQLSLQPNIGRPGDVPRRYHVQVLSPESFDDILRQDSQEIDSLGQLVRLFQEEAADNLGLGFGGSDL